MLDLSNTDKNLIRIDTSSIGTLSPETRRIRIIANEGDVVDVSDADEWRLSDPLRENDEFYLIAAKENGGSETIEIKLARPWHNFLRAGDVNNDGNVTANDALRIINELARRAYSDRETQMLSDAFDVSEWPSAYFDHNADGRATALDALRVINQLARQASGEGEGEGEAATLVLTPTERTEGRDLEFQSEYHSFELTAPVVSPVSAARVADNSSTHPLAQIVDHPDKRRELTAAVDHLLSDDSFLYGLDE